MLISLFFFDRVILGVAEEFRELCYCESPSRRTQEREGRPWGGREGGVERKMDN